MKIQIAYDGDAVKSGVMDVEELAPALLAIGSTLQEANNILNDGNARLKVNVKSDFKTGSFEVVLELVQSLAEQVSFMLDGRHTWTAGEIAAFVGFSGGTTVSLVKLVRWLKNRRVKSMTTLQNGDVEIEVDGGDKIIAKPEVVKLTKSSTVRTSLHAILKPLSKEGVDVFIVREKTEDIEVIRKSESDDFIPPKLEEKPLAETVREAAFQLVGVFFEDGLKWRLSDGDSRINAEMKDANFQHKVDAGLPFRKGDILLLRLRTKQVQTGTGIRNEHIIEEVKKHITKSEQTELAL